ARTNTNCVRAASVVPNILSKANNVIKKIANAVAQYSPVKAGKNHCVIFPSANPVLPPTITQPIANRKPLRNPQELPINLDTQTDIAPALGIPTAISAKATIKNN